MHEAVRTIKGYEVLRELGRGGMAVVYLARQQGLGREVALKELAGLHAGDPDWAKRFLREAHLAGSLSHPNIVTVHEYFEHEGVPYLAMEYLEAGSLRQFMGGGLNLAQIAGVLEGVLAGLAHAESHGIVHRDLKPENLMVTSEGRIKIADFGIAKAIDTAGSDLTFKTVTGMFCGTPTYAAPEQAMGTDVGPSADLYSLGIISYELLSGKVPFADPTETPVRILLRHVNDPVPSLHTTTPGLDAQFVHWVERLLEKAPENRPGSAEEAWNELEEIVLRLLGPMWRREAALTAATGAGKTRALTPAAFELTVKAGEQGARSSPPPQPVAGADGATVKAGAADPTALAGSSGAGAIAGPAPPGGAARTRWLGRRGIAVLAGLLALVAAVVVVLLLTMGGGSEPVSLQWSFRTGGLESSSPLVVDDRVILASRTGNVFAVEASTGEEIWRAPTGSIAFSSPAEAGGIVYVGSEDFSVYALDLATGEQRWRFETEGAVHSSPAVVDGVLYIGSDDANLYALDAASGEELWRFATAGLIQSTPAVVDGLVYFGSRDNFVYALDAATGEEKWRSETGAEVWSSPAVADGSVYIGSSDRNLYALDAIDGGEEWRFPTGGFVSSSPHLAGGVLYFGSFDNSLYAVESAAPRERWSFATGNAIYSSPAIADGVVYFGSHDANVYALDAATGEELWRYETGGLVGSSPTVANGVVYIGSDDGFFYALRSAVSPS
jgi:outer membrane protein assembly factor BamB/predicted Ser/Thr protein kinase